MKRKSFFTIGEISKIARIPIKTLRFYDKIGLLKPDFIDPETKYRYYSNHQLFLISIIKELKLFEFSLSDIKEFMMRNDLRRIGELYQKKKLEINKQIEHLSKISQRIENRFEAFQDMFVIYENQKKNGDRDNNHYYIELKNIPERTIVFKRAKSVFDLENFSMRCILLHNLIEENNLYVKGPFMAIFHEDYDKMDVMNADIEACGPIYSDKNISFPFVRTLPAGLYATTVCKGAHEKSIEAYTALKSWILKRNYKVIGQTIKIYILNIKLIDSPEDFISEIQIQIEK